MAKPAADHFLERCLLAVDEAPDLPPELDGRVMAALEARWAPQAAAPRRPFLKLVRPVLDAPPLLALAAALALLLSPFVAYRWATSFRPAEFSVAAAAGASAAGGVPLSPGQVLRGSQDLRTAEGGALAIAYGGTLELRLPGSSAVRFLDGKRNFQFALDSGALYLSRSRPLPGKDVSLSIRSQTILLTGTRLYAELTGASGYRLVCLEGSLEVHGGGTSAPVLSKVRGGRFVDIGEDGKVLREGSIDELPASFRTALEGIADGSGQGAAGSLGAPGAAENRLAMLSQENPQEEASPTPPPFTVRSAGKLSGFSPSGAYRTFLSPFSLKGSSYAALYDGIYRFGPDGASEALALKKAPAAAPVLIGSRLLVFFADSLGVYGTDFSLKQEIGYPQSGTLQSNYGPTVSGSSLLLPLAGVGLYRFLPDDGSFTLLKSDVFSSTALPVAGGYLSSTFYKDSYEFVGKDGKSSWRYELPGSSYVPPAAFGSRFLLYSEEEAGQRLILLDRNGQKNGAVSLPAPLVADLLPSGGIVLAVSTSGDLLAVDPAAGSARAVKRLFAESYGAGQWRNVSLHPAGSELPTITSEGELEVFSLPSLESTLKAPLPASAPFDLQPFEADGRIYAIDRAGELFLVERRAAPAGD